MLLCNSGVKFVIVQEGIKASGSLGVKDEVKPSSILCDYPIYKRPFKVTLL